MVVLAPQRRGQTKSFLRPPTVVTTAQAGVFYGPKVTLAKTLDRLSRRRPHYVLRMPVVVTQDLARPTDIHLVAPRDRRPRTIWELRPPVVVTAAVAEAFYGPKVTLAKARPRRTTIAKLRPVPAAFRPVGSVAITLAPSFRGKPKSRLRPPVVVNAAVTETFYGPRVELARVKQRGVPRSKLRTPGVVYDAQIYKGIGGTLAPPRATNPPVHSILRLPRVVIPAQLFQGIGGKLTPPRATRPITIWRLRPPTVVQPFFIARRTKVTLARIKPAPVHSILRKPTDLVDQADLGFVRVHLAYSRRGKPRSRLSPPTVVQAFQARPIDTTLVRIRPVPTQHVLRRPVDLVDREPISASFASTWPTACAVARSRSSASRSSSTFARRRATSRSRSRRRGSRSPSRSCGPTRSSRPSRRPNTGLRSRSPISREASRARS